MTVKATIALGSNLGDRAGHISRALRGLGRFCTVERTASLYESAAAYVTDQPAFLNTACTVSTALAPRELLAALKGVEREIGRQAGLPTNQRNHYYLFLLPLLLAPSRARETSSSALLSQLPSLSQPDCAEIAA